MKPQPKPKMMTQPITAINSGGKRIPRMARGRTNKELRDSIIFILTDKKDKQFMAAINKGSGLTCPDHRVYFNKYINKGVHAQVFLKNCSDLLDNLRHIDIMCMLKSNYSRPRMAILLFTSPSDLKTILKNIFEILGVADEIIALQMLHL